MPVRLIKPYGGQLAGTLYFGTDEGVLRDTGNADDQIELATDYAPSTRLVTAAAANVTRTAKTYWMNSSTPQTITLGSTGYLPVGSVLTIEQKGVGPFTIVAGAGVSVTSATGSLLSKGQNSVAHLVKDGPNSWTAYGDLGGRVAPLAQKLREAAPNAIDVLTQPVYIAPSAWAASTAYVKGEAVANAGNWYICNSSGTSDVSGGPTGTLTTLITDGTAKWTFFSPARAAVSEGAPTLSSGTTVPSGLAVSLATLTNLGTKMLMPTALYFSDAGGGQAPLAVVPKDGSFVIGASQVEFWTDAPKFSWQSRFNPALRFVVDGVSVTVGDFKTAAPSGISYNTLDFNGVRKNRKVTVIGTDNSIALLVTASDRVWAGNKPAITGLWVGDSWAAGAAPGPNRRDDTSVNHVARALGMGEGMHNASVGGTGFFTTNGGTAYNYLQRLTAGASYIQAKTFDFVVLEGTGNDIATATNAVLQAQMLSTMQLVRQLQPSAAIFVTEATPVTDPSQASVINMNAVLKAAFDQFADGNSYFIPLSSTSTPEAQAWIDTGNSGVLINTVDVHPLDAGLRYLGQRFAKAIRNAVS